ALPPGAHRLAARKYAALPNAIPLAYSGPIWLQLQFDLSGRLGDLTRLDRFLREFRSCRHICRWLPWLAGPIIVPRQAWRRASVANTANSAVLYRDGRLRQNVRT